MGLWLFGGQHYNDKGDIIEMHNLMKQKFLLINYQWDLFFKLHDLKLGNKSVVEYMKEFFLVQGLTWMN